MHLNYPLCDSNEHHLLFSIKTVKGYWTTIFNKEWDRFTWVWALKNMQQQEFYKL